jgi:predicted metal-dependent peptidase
MFLQFDYMQGWISFFDTKVSRPVSIESIEEIEDLQVTGGGGTDYKPLFASLNDFFPARYPAAIIILTDGWAPFPAQSDALGIPVLWMITDPDRHIPWGIRIDTEIS